MPRRISKSSPKDFEPKVKNKFSLGLDSNIDNDFKPFKIGDIATGLEFKLGSIRSTADEFITSKETTEQLNVTKIKGNKVGSQTEPQFLFQSPDETTSSAGLWFNCFGETGNLIRSAGTTGHLHMEADSAQFYYIGDHADNSFLWKFGDAVGGTELMSLEHEGELKLYSTADSGDYFSIAIGSAGVTTITTVDDGGAAANLILDPDGEINLTPVTEIKSDAPLKIKEASDAVADTAAYGQLWVKTATPNELYFTTDAGDDIQLTSGTSAAGGGASALNDLSDVTYSSGDLTITSLDKIISGDLHFDSSGDITIDAGGSNIYFKATHSFLAEITEGLNTSILKVLSSQDTGDYFSITTTTHGATTIATVDDDATAAHLTIDIDGHTQFNNPVGFDQHNVLYNSSDTEVLFKTQGNKAFVTFGSGNITDLNLNLPATSGNFVLLLKQDGTGSRTVTNYKAFDSAGNAANGSATVKFAGGSNPTLTTDANHVDILSFYWDADNEICYGVATLDFQF